MTRVPEELVDCRKKSVINFDNQTNWRTKMKKKQTFTWILMTALMVTLAGCKTLQETAEGEKYTAPEGVTLMTEAELRETLVGNTYAGDSVKYDGSYIEFIQPDGKINGLWNGTDRYKGEWAISGNIWCYKYKSSNGCNTLSKSGDTIYWYQLDGSTMGGKATVTKGDSKDLAK
jgi:hypothetical protein